MSRKHDETISLLASHARLKLAADLIRWSVNGESAKIIDGPELLKSADALTTAANVLFEAAKK